MSDISGTTAGGGAKHGQALLEFVVVMVVILTLLAAVLQIGLLARARTGAMSDARAAAGRAALSHAYPSPAEPPPLLRTWRPGPDGRMHTADDIPVAGSPELIRRAVLAHARPDALAVALPLNPVSRSHQEPAAMNWVHGLLEGRVRSESIEMLPLTRRLFYDTEAITWDAEVWMVWMRGVP